jgi:hypothetical protein
MAHDCTLPQRLQACFRCRGRDLITHLDAGDVVCRSCGEIQRDRIIDNTDEVRSYLDDDSNKDRESRTSGIPERNGLRGSSFKTMFVNGGSSARGGGDYCSSLNRSTEMLERADERMAGLLASHIEKVCNSLKLTSSRVMVRTRVRERVFDRSDYPGTGKDEFGDEIFYQSSRDGKNRSVERRHLRFTCFFLTCRSRPRLYVSEKAMDGLTLWSAHFSLVLFPWP